VPLASDLGRYSKQIPPPQCGNEPYEARQTCRRPDFGQVEAREPAFIAPTLRVGGARSQPMLAMRFFNRLKETFFGSEAGDWVRGR
jgi:hypothetical protein